MLVEEVLWPSSAASAEPIADIICYGVDELACDDIPPVRPRLSGPSLFVVEVEVDPALSFAAPEDVRGSRAEPVLLPTGAAIAREESRVVMRMEKRMMSVGVLRLGPVVIGGLV